MCASFLLNFAEFNLIRFEISYLGISANGQLLNYITISKKERIKCTLLFVRMHNIYRKMLYATPSLLSSFTFVAGNRGNHGRSNEHSQILVRRKTAKMLIAVVAIFGVCYLPVHLLNILRCVCYLPVHLLNILRCVCYLPVHLLNIAK